MQQAAWLFTRGHESVRMEAQKGPLGLQLAIFGPGNTSNAHDFSNLNDLEVFRIGQEENLISQGFVVSAIVERRGGGERRQPGRASSSDRRR